MEIKEFKIVFNKVACSFGFEKKQSLWVIESPDCIVVLELQRSNFGNNYELNIKSFINNLFSRDPSLNAAYLKKYMGDILLRQPKIYNYLFDLDSNISDEYRGEQLNTFFKNFISPISSKLLTIQGILNLEKEGKIILLPAVKDEIAAR